MKFILILLALTACTSKNTLDVNNNQTLPPVTTKEDPYLKESSQFVTSYALTLDQCKITWQVSGDQQENKAYHLRLRYGGVTDKCPSFNKQQPAHQKILSKVFNQYPKEKFNTVSTDSLYLIEPSYSWNVKIANHAIENQDWLDYTKNYPNHQSKKSSNEIFVNITNQTSGYQELSQFFLVYGLNIKLKSVEKVFAQKLEKLPFKEKLKSTLFNRRILYDAGILDFELKSQ